MFIMLCHQYRADPYKQALLCKPAITTINVQWLSKNEYILLIMTHISSVPPQAAKAQAESESTQKAEREVTRMVVVMVMGFLVCWMPYASFALWVVNNRGQPFDLRLATIPSCLSKASTVYNPVIYILLNKQVGSLLQTEVFTVVSM